uniref:Uncharacterized protein n=1 Tax=Avena sativa TaxID=4498 RepID=A0ACD5Z3V3_AVESA
MATRCFFPRDHDAAGQGHRQQHQSKAAAEALEQLHHGGRVLSREEVGGAVRVKIVVSKRELKKMVAALGSGAGGEVAAAAAVASGDRRSGRQRASSGGTDAEQRLQSLRRRSMRRAAEETRRMQANGEWEPGLQSIPEEVY